MTKLDEEIAKESLKSFMPYTLKEYKEKHSNLRFKVGGLGG